MTVNPARYGAAPLPEPVIHELPAFHLGSTEIAVRLAIWRTEDGAWRGRLLFGPPGAEVGSTADILCAPTESEFWDSVRDLGQHHLRDLYRSLVA